MPLASIGIVDLLAKRAVSASLLPGERRTVVPGMLDVTLVENTRGAMGLFGSHPIVLVALAIGVLVLVGVLSRRTVGRSAFAQVGFGLIAGGALGNVVDRLTHGYVIDFLAVPHVFVFNVADAAVTAGVVLIALPALARGRAAARA